MPASALASTRRWRSNALARVFPLAGLWLSLGPLAAAADAPSPASIGRQIFNDVSLSASQRQSCASCHVPAKAHAQDSGSAVQSGGVALDVPGFRAVPSLRYLNVELPFFFQNDGTPTGGFNRDGRANDLIEQARRPFLAAHEMANADAASVAARLRAAPYAAQFRQVFGAEVFSDPDTAFLAALYALSDFESRAPEFRPYSSKFDAFLRGEIALSAPELRGFALFNRPDKGNCAACHPSTRQSDRSPPAFTDYTYDNLGVPRNAAIPANADPGYFDLGLCGPDRTDLASRAALCGAFKVPTLRNVAIRAVFFHNGKFDNLDDVLHFYVQRDTQPARWYPLRADGAADKFDDLPAPLRGSVNTAEPPYDRRPGQAPRLSDDEIADVIAFLRTLTDGYDPLTDSADPARDIATNP